MDGPIRAVLVSGEYVIACWLALQNYVVQQVVGLTIQNDVRSSAWKMC